MVAPSTSGVQWHHARKVVQKAGPDSRANNRWLEKLQATVTDILATRGPKPFPTKVQVNGFKISAKYMPSPNSHEDLNAIYKKHGSFSSGPSA